ncbi:monovalent cation/H(+) antiporter subunit G [Candidatus Roseilinea sp. NK_OTU-006]|jgi:multicomponent Na+:H+ antiporter subunit G|uniref:monovalent cation/H(+) antiporter subunit G n=1 Tax=Candidatus Roseilinea sp. NK_OTU-006 TaxID=2704250 RepID=UPI00145F72D1|nr:monovalent cation/H(+) antiporter subunit G [Candidatus Roseilinea sp. NK_OTU-006]
MKDLGYLIAIVAILIGTFFSIIGIIGLVRLPDVYSRMHATGKVSTFGVVLLTVAAVFATPLAGSKALVLIALLILAGPVVSHAISSASYRLGIPMKSAARDDLAGKRIQPPANQAQPARAEPAE